MQYIDLIPHDGYSVPQCDARLPNSEELLPPTVVLDFMYGATVYNKWKGDKNLVDERMEECYENLHLPILNMSSNSPSPTTTSSEDSYDDTDIDPTETCSE
jgi:hypothetical protein